MGMCERFNRASVWYSNLVNFIPTEAQIIFLIPDIKKQEIMGFFKTGSSKHKLQQEYDMKTERCYWNN